MRPNVAAAAPAAAAAGKPASSSRGTKPSAVPWPPTSVSAPHTTPSKGGACSAPAKATPTRFCTTASRVAPPSKITSARPPVRSSCTGASNPTQVKNPTSSGRLRFLAGRATHAWSGVTSHVHHPAVTLVCHEIVATPVSARSKTTVAHSSPPTTGTGTLKRDKT